MNPSSEAVPLLKRCLVCGAKNLRDVEVLSPALIETWELAPAEVDYVNAQQGRHCADCRSTLRCMALAQAILRFCGANETFAEFAEHGAAQRLRILEINEAGGVSAYLSRLPGRIFAAFPRVDMQSLPYADASFDLVRSWNAVACCAMVARASSRCRSSSGGSREVARD